MCELDADTLREARVVVDQRAGALAQAGELAGLGAADVVEIGEVLAGTAPGRSSPQERTVFKSVGNGIQDLVVTALAYERATSLGLGEEIRWPGRTQSSKRHRARLRFLAMIRVDCCSPC